MTELGQNAGRIGNLTITSEILAALLDAATAAATSILRDTGVSQLMAGTRQARDRHPQDGPRGAGRAVQHARPGPLLHRAHGGRVRELPGTPTTPITPRSTSLREAIPRGLRVQWIERAFLPTFTFGESDVVVVLGQDGWSSTRPSTSTASRSWR